MIRLAAPLALALAVLQVAPAHADDDPVTTPERREANALYKEGVRLFRAHDYAGALDLFHRAWETFPAPLVAYSLATTLKQMGRTVEAANWYQHFIDDPGAEPQLVTDARTVLGVLDDTVGRVDVSLDGMAEVQIGDGPWQQVRDHLTARVAPGSVIVRGRRPGYVAEATAQVEAGAEQPMALRWTDAAPAPHEPTRPAPPAHLPPPVAIAHEPAPAPSHGHRRMIALGVAGGGVALVAASLLFQHASSVHADREVALSQGGADPAAVELEYHRALVDHDVALAGGAAAAVAVAAGIALWVTAPREASVHLAPVADQHTVGVLFTGHF